jgi:hypothetical protein
MAQYDIAHPIAAYSTHFFPADAGIPVFVTVYKTGSASYDDVAGYLVFSDQPMGGTYRDRLIGEHNAIVKHFRSQQFAAVQTLLQHRLDSLKLTMSIHYVGDELAGGWTTLDAGVSPGLESSFVLLVRSEKSVAAPTTTVAATSNVPAKKAPRKK